MWRKKHISQFMSSVRVIIAYGYRRILSRYVEDNDLTVGVPEKRER